MGRLILIFSGAFLTFAAAHLSCLASDTVLSVKELISRVEKNYAQSPTFQSKFEQLFTGKNSGEIKSLGTVQFKKPGMMKWLYEKPNKKLIVSRENRMWIYDRGDSQAILDNNFRKENLPASMSFLWGEEKLDAVFNCKILSVYPLRKSHMYTVELVPRESLQNVDRINFVIDSGDFLIRETRIFDLFGNENRLIFKNPSLGAKIPDKDFDFQPPKGVTVVTQPEKLVR